MPSHDGAAKWCGRFAEGREVSQRDRSWDNEAHRLMQWIRRYANMDFIFASALKGVPSKRVVVSYDIACQWHKNLAARLKSIVDTYRPSWEEFEKAFVIPKFHIGSHGKACQTKHSLNFLLHMGRTDGENIERGWAWLNPVSLSTREMGPGTRHDALDDQWSFWNWRIQTRLGASESSPPRVAARL